MNHPIKDFIEHGKGNFMKLSAMYGQEWVSQAIAIANDALVKEELLRRCRYVLANAPADAAVGDLLASLKENLRA